MEKGLDTKNRILEKGSEIIHLKGYNHTGIQEILDAAEVPKGSFYNYFSSKEDFGIQVIDYFIKFFSSIIEDILEKRGMTAFEKINGILNRFIEVFRSRDFAYGCPIGNLSQEMGDLSPAFRKKLKEAIDSMANLYRDLLSEAQSAGDISKELDLQKTAYFIVTSWHGALGRMKIEKSAEPLEDHRNFIVKYILKDI